jgi:hypothetical protein
MNLTIKPHIQFSENVFQYLLILKLIEKVNCKLIDQEKLVLDLDTSESVAGQAEEPIIQEI